GGLLAAASVSIGASQHAFWPVHAGGALATHGGGIDASFSPAGARVRTAAGSLSLSLPSIRRGARELATPSRAPSSTRNEVAFRARTISELYRNGPYGLEQAFTLPRRPLPGTGRLILASRLRGTLAGRQVGSQILFAGASRAPALSYGELSARD